MSLAELLASGRLDHQPRPAGHIFVSHSRRDRAVVDVLVAHLRGAGCRLWISDTRLHCPAWWEVAEPQIVGCSAMLLVVSPHALAADGVRREVRHATMLGKPIVPVPLHPALLRLRAR